jgi:hypothetical protein
MSEAFQMVEVFMGGCTIVIIICTLYTVALQGIDSFMITRSVYAQVPRSVGS